MPPLLYLPQNTKACAALQCPVLLRLKDVIGTPH